MKVGSLQTLWPKTFYGLAMSSSSCERTTREHCKPSLCRRYDKCAFWRTTTLSPSAKNNHKPTTAKGLEVLKVR